MALNTFLSTDLFTSLTQEERLRVSLFASDRPSDLPKFFNAGTQQLGDVPNESITKEFEAFLILQTIQSPDKLSDAMVWFNEAATLQLNRDDRDTLLEEAYGNEKADALAKVQELSERTRSFATFRESFQAVEVGPEVDPLQFPPTRFSQIPEISLIMRDSQAAMGEVSSTQSRSEFRVVSNEVLDLERVARINTGDSLSGIADNKIAEELLSWRNVITDIQARVTGGV
jgi:hypothetical protein